MTEPPDRLSCHHVRSGCDVISVGDVADSLDRFGDRYLHRVFTHAEIEDCDGPEQVSRLAARFAAKEATIKAFAEPVCGISTAGDRGRALRRTAGVAVDRRNGRPRSPTGLDRDVALAVAHPVSRHGDRRCALPVKDEQIGYGSVTVP